MQCITVQKCSTITVLFGKVLCIVVRRWDNALSCGLLGKWLSCSTVRTSQDSEDQSVLWPTDQDTSNRFSLEVFTATAHCTLHTVYGPLQTANFTLHTAHFTLKTKQSTLHTKPAHCSLHTVHCTLYRAYVRLYWLPLPSPHPIILCQGQGSEAWETFLWWWRTALATG